MNCARCQAKLPEGKYQCRMCRHWNNQEIGVVSSETSNSGEVIRLSKVKTAKLDRIESGPWDYVFGGGMVRTSICLLGGKRGAGKSTLFLHMCAAIAKKLNRPVAYIATEESVEQIKERADRLGIPEEVQELIIMISAMGGLPDIGAILIKEGPAAVFLDSLQGLAGESEDVALQLARLMKEISVRIKAPIIMSAHVNKSDDIAGLEAVQHVVDSVMTFFPDDVGIRELMVEKNRDGKAFISTTFRMTATGLEVLELMCDMENEDLDDEEDEDE